MTKPRKWILRITAILVVVVVAGVIAEDLWDDESLFAVEEMTMDEAVTGTLPEGDVQDEDALFDALFGDDAFDALDFDDDWDDLTAADRIADEQADAFEAVDSDVGFPEDLFEDTVGTGAVEPDDLFDDMGRADDWDADALLGEMMEAGDQDRAVAETLDQAGLGDVFDGELDDGGLGDDDWAADDLDDLFGGMVEDADEPVADDLDFDDFDDLFGAMLEDTDPPPPADPVDEDWAIDDLVDAEPEKGITPDPVPPAADDDDLEALFAELAVELEPAAPVDPDPEPEVEPTPSVYDDEFALNGDLLRSLAEEGRRVAEDEPAVPERVVPDEPVAAVDPVEPEPVVARPDLRDVPPGTVAFEEAERLRRAASENHAINRLERGERAMRDRDYRRAIQLFEEALRTLPQRPDLEPARARARRGLADAYFRHAGALVEMGDLEAALTSAQGAVRHGHRRGPDAVRRIQERLDAPEKPEPPVRRPHRWDEEEFRKIDREIEQWLRRGREAYLNGEFERAILSYESVLARDPQNKEAIRMMRAAAGRQYDRSTMELDATRQRMMAAVRDTWNPRQYGLHEDPIDPEQDLPTTVREDEIQRQRILGKMRDIRIPEVSFRQANIRDVLTFLQQQSVEFDPTPERTGVNFILQLDPGRRAPAAVAPPPRRADPFADPAATDAPRSVDEVLVTFTALDISLMEALDIVVDVADLKYRIRGNVVMVVPRDAPAGDIVHRMYDVLPSAIQRLQDLTAGAGARRQPQARRGSGDFLTIEGGADLGGEDVDLRAFFEEMGVRWPAGSSIKFIRGLGKLVVANTQENLAVFESILSILNVVPYQIEIEARFIEVAQTDVDSLGLEWMLTDTWQIAEMAADANLSPAARRRLVMRENASMGGFTAGNRFLTQGDSRGPMGRQVMDQVASVSSVLTNPELTMVLHALEQRGHTDLLSAPKITTQSGQQATIKVVTEYIYPTAFDATGIDGGTSDANIAGGTVGAVVTPLDFQTREVGVILEVLPEVSPEGQMINLLLSPEVVSEPTWRNYGSTYTSFDPNGNPVEQQLNMEMPFFHTRKLRTNLLIYNGATVVMGGMITEVRNSVDDSIPFLGDIPILGRLFRSRYDSSEKRNLLIFVTARLVDPAGRPLEREHIGIDDSIAERLAGAELDD